MPDHISLRYTKKMSRREKFDGKEVYLEMDRQKDTSIISHDHYSVIQLGHEVVGEIPKDRDTR